MPPGEKAEVLERCYILKVMLLIGSRIRIQFRICVQVHVLSTASFRVDK
jgi:hypothetical protein